jgi:FkbM family methyltransferase
MIYKKIGFKTSNFIFYTHLPDWFLTDRGDQGIPFNKLLKDDILPEIQAYKKMHDYMLQFTKEAVFLDVGAHIGLISIPIAMEGYDVIAIEPVTYDLFSGNARLNSVEDFITIISCAAYYENKTMTIYAPVHDDCTSLSSDLAETGGPIRLVRTQTVILDELLEKQKIQDRVRFIKIDVQGFEYNVLKGLKQTLALPQEKHVLLEWDENFMQKTGINPVEITTFFNSLGFQREPWDAGDALFVKKGIK